MTKRRINISIIIMLLAIVAIAAFQLYWLRKTFVEEKENLSFRTNVLFREAMQHVQADKLHLDTNVNFKFRTRYNAAGTLDVMRRRALGDSMRRKKVMAGTEIVLQKGKVRVVPDSLPGKRGPDSLHTIRVWNSPAPNGGGEIIQVLRGVESIHDSITAEEVSARYAKLLKDEGLNLQFAITKTKAIDREDGFFPVEDFERNEITLGFTKPVTFHLDLEVHDLAHLHSLIAALRAADGVSQVERI